MLDLSKNYFELFGLPAEYQVEIPALRERYRELQGAVHPDRYAAGSDEEKRKALQSAAYVNEAFETLKDPMLRARYLLSLHGVDMELGAETTRDAAFLMQQLEMREDLEALRHTDDSFDTLGEFMDRVSGMIKALVSRITVDFETPSKENLEDARETVQKMQFLNKLYAEAQAVEAQLEEEFG
ncbi:Fe-S protein assembly co-chaperone HscB [Solemya velum gill symbiont]|uniref:Fe-S protein assembly co-chaperone HscB n=1 Tax=Solemya velum gill symbiont TaxID=2340 RepID=UPI000996F3EC|nr:Fe-S protein assembly co-chaperone HscB [Solemya velum gill symbiont]OOZ14343.1 Fe-S protein assembly co-chaperone HscB [Solemya velum gill symbiont]